MRLNLPDPGAHDVTSPCPSPAEDLTGFLTWHRRVFGVARMEETDEEKAAREAKEKADRDSKTFTQAEVDRLLAREKDQGERAGETKGMRKALEQLGVDPDKVKPEELAATLRKAMEADEAQKSEAQKAKDAADERERAAKAREDKAAEREHTVSLERALERAGVGKGEDDDEKRAALIARAARLVDVEVGADSAKIKTAVDALKDDMPQMFTEAGDGKGLPHGDPGGKGNNGTGGGKGKSGVAAGREEAIRRGWIKPEKQTA